MRIWRSLIAVAVAFLVAGLVTGAGVGGVLLACRASPTATGCCCHHQPCALDSLTAPVALNEAPCCTSVTAPSSAIPPATASLAAFLVQSPAWIMALAPVPSPPDVLVRVGLDEPELLATGPPIPIRLRHLLL